MTARAPGPADYEIWAAGYLLANFSNPAGEHDHNGLTNFQKYAFGLNPTSGSSVNPISRSLDKSV